MKDTSLKYLMGELLRNKRLIWDIIDHFHPEDIEQGRIVIPQDLINDDLRAFILEATDPYLDDYMLFFENNSIYCNMDLSVKQLGKIRAKVQLNITEFTFDSQAHIIHLTFREHVKSTGNLLQSMALKAAKLRATYFETVVTFLKLDYMLVEGSSLTIYLDKIQGFEKVPRSLQLKYLECNKELLKFNFNVNK